MEDAGGTRVVLAAWKDEDFWLLERVNEAAMTRHLGGPESEEKLVTRHWRYLAMAALENDGGMFRVEVAGSGETVGSVGYWPREWQGATVWETGWGVLPEFQRRGLAVAAAREVSEVARAAGKHRYLHAFPSAGNAASNAVCSKAGFELRGEVAFEYPKGTWMQCQDWRIDLTARRENPSPPVVEARKYAGVEYSGPPLGEVRAPAPIAERAGARTVQPVWRNSSGGVTFQLGEGEGRLFAKWAPAGSGLDLGAEAVRLGWAARFTPVPRVVDHGVDGAGEWLLTGGLPGDSAVSPRWKAEPETAVRALGAGLRALHDRLPVDDCPFSWSVRRRRASAQARGELDPGLDLDRDLPEAPPVDRLVVCHGDACAPNTLLGEDGSWSAHVDMGALGVADRWADLAVGAWSLGINYGPGWDDTYYDAYGIAPDPERIAFYRRLGGVSR